MPVDAVASGWWSRMQPEELTAYLVGLCLLSGTLASLQVGAIITSQASEHRVAPASVASL